jgi:hypothetical protein
VSPTSNIHTKHFGVPLAPRPAHWLETAKQLLLYRLLTLHPWQQLLKVLL